jgi:hypothetical protein
LFSRAGLLLEESAPAENDVVYSDIMCFQQCISYIIACFFACQYPQYIEIEKIYASRNIKFNALRVACMIFCWSMLFLYYIFFFEICLFAFSLWW